MSGNRFKFWLVVIGLAAAAVYSFWYAFKSWGKNRVIEDTPTSRVRSAAQGYVELDRPAACCRRMRRTKGR